MEKVLAVDYGRKRVGLAVSDPMGITARPLEAIVRSGSGTTGELIDGILKECEEENAGRIVVGLPVQMDGTEGLAAEEVRRFVEELRARTDLPVEQEDERLSSKAAHAVMKHAGVKHKKRKERVDSAAALVVLQSFLAKRKRG